MSEIIVRGFEIGENCAECWFCNECDDEYFCAFISDPITYCVKAGTKNDDCPAENLKLHGRLIEADELYESCALDPCIDVMASAKRINEYMQLKIDNCSTIIPASE